MSSRAGPSSAPMRHSGRRDGYSDSDLVSLTAQLTLEDIEELERRQKGKRRVGAPLTDAELALRLSAEEARASIIFNNDRALAQQLQEADESPNMRRTRLQAEANLNPPLFRQQPVPQAVAASGSRRGWLGSIISWFYLGPPSSTPTTFTEAAAPSPLRLTGNKCVSCQDPIRGVEIRSPCGHHYDKSCITDLFEASTKDESLFPPRCCRQPISVASVLPHLTQTLAAAFTEKSREFGTLKRVYCASPKCSRFLGPQYEGWFPSTLECADPICPTRTCNACKGPVQGYHICKKDHAEKEVLALSKAAGWARCPACSQMIELALGCYHMTCLCKAEFCYLCQKKWKTCKCSQWDEGRLVAAAEARVNAQYAIRRPPAPPVQAAVPVAPHPRPPRPAPPRPAPLVAVRPARPTPDESVQYREAALHRLFGGPAPPAQASEAAVMPHPLYVRSSTPVPAAPTEVRERIPVVRPSEPSAGGGLARSAAVKVKTTTDVDSRRWARLVREAVDELRVNHDCVHQNWRYRHGGGQCQTCHHQLPLYLFRCHGCQTLACNRCRRNRL